VGKGGARGITAWGIGDGEGVGDIGARRVLTTYERGSLSRGHTSEEALADPIDFRRALNVAVRSPAREFAATRPASAKLQQRGGKEVASTRCEIRAAPVSKAPKKHAVTCCSTRGGVGGWMKVVRWGCGSRAGPRYRLLCD
jgi:hypothetical protein